MSYPLDSFAQAVFDKLEPLTRDDAANGNALAIFLGALGAMFQLVDGLVIETDAGPPWAIAMDVDRAPSAALGWLAQFVGVTLQQGLDDVTQRARIKETDGWKRGTPGAIAGAAHQYLTGAKSVIIRERDPAASPGDPAYGLTVITYTSQTPNSSQVLAALLAQKPAGVKLVYSVLTGQDYQALLTNHPTYSNVYSTYLTYQGVATETPGT